MPYKVRIKKNKDMYSNIMFPVLSSNNFSMSPNLHFGDHNTAMEDIHDPGKGITIDSLKTKNRYELQILAMQNGCSKDNAAKLSKDGLINLMLSAYDNDSSQILRTQIWNTHIGKEMGEHPCLLCGERQITQLDFKYGYGVDTSRGGQDSQDNILPICHVCFSYKGTKTIEEFLRSIGKNQLPLLSEKIRLLFSNCIISDAQLNLYDAEYIARTISTNKMLWDQFTHLMENNPYNQKIKIGLHYKQLILFI